MSNIQNFSLTLRKFHSSSRLKKFVELTAKRYPHLKRGNYAILSDKHVGFFQSILSPHQIITDANDLAGYNVDWMHSVRGKVIKF